MVRIPTAVLEAAHVHLDQPVDVREEGGRIVIEPVRPAGNDIDALVAGITDDNRHEQAGHRPAVVLSPARYNGRAGRTTRSKWRWWERQPAWSWQTR